MLKITPLTGAIHAKTPAKTSTITFTFLTGLSMYDVKMWVEQASGQDAPATKKKQQLLEAQRSALLFTHKGYRCDRLVDLPAHSHAVGFL